MVSIIINIVAAVGSLIGILCLAHKIKTGFIVFFIVELCMFYIGMDTKQYGVVAMSIIYFFSNIYAYYQWSKINDR
jgi:nicotinamide riboside transporter PnuC